MESCTAMAEGILRRPCDRRSGHDRKQAKNVVGENVHRKQIPVALLEVGHRFEGIAGKGGVRPTESYGDQQTPLRVGKHALGGPYEKEPEKKRSGNVDDER